MTSETLGVAGRPASRRIAPGLPGCLLLLIGVAISEQALALCGGPLDQNNFGRPIDFNDSREGARIKLVVKHHFTPEVAALIRGTTAPLPGDIHYTLRHIPNHYGALDAMARYQMQHPGGSQRYFTVDCYFERAFAFRPKDAQLYQLYGTYLHRTGSWDKAAAAYARAEELGLDSSELYYNLGLLEFQRKNYDAAASYAAKAYAGGYPLPGLRNKLSAAGIRIPAN